MTMYSYKHNDEIFDSIVEQTYALAEATLKEVEIADRKDQVRELDEAIVKYCLAGTRYEKAFEEKGLEVMKNPSIGKNSEIRANFDLVVAQIINPILPMVANRDLVRFLAEVRQIGWGDTARFQIKSNELYKVNEVAEGVTRGILQPIHNNEITVDSKKLEIAVELDWYALAAGVLDFGEFGLRAARSFENYTFLQIVGAMTSAMTAMGSAYSVNSFSDANWTNIIQRVSAANGNCEVFAIGTLTALGNVIPAAGYLQMGLGEEIAKKGFLDRYKGARLVCLDQAIGYDKVNTTADFIVPDNKIYFIPVAADKPVKIVYEGDTITASAAPEQTTDRTYRMNIQFYQGVAAVTGSKYGCMTIGANS